MAQYGDAQNYGEMIQALQQFISTVGEACDEMENAGKECVENTDGDEASVKSNARLGTSLQKYRETLQEAQTVISAMQEELEEMVRAAQIIDSE